MSKPGFGKYDTIQNNNKPRNERECEYCKKVVPLKRCSRCHVVQYCSRECQTADWNSHKIVCKQIVAPAKADHRYETEQDFAKFFLSRVEHMKQVNKKADKRDPITGVRLQPVRFSRIDEEHSDPPNPLKKRKEKYPELIASLKQHDCNVKQVRNSVDASHVKDLLALLLDAKIKDLAIRERVLKVLSADQLKDAIKQHFAEILSIVQLPEYNEYDYWHEFACPEFFEQVKLVACNREAHYYTRARLIEILEKVSSVTIASMNNFFLLFVFRWVRIISNVLVNVKRL